MGGVIVMAVRLLRRRLMSMVIMCSGGVAVIVVRRCRCVIIVCSLPVIIMALHSRGAMVVVPMVGMGGGMAVVVVAVSLSGRVGGMVVVTLAGVGTVIRAMALTCAVIVVRLVLVAHCDSVPQPLSAVFAAKSV